MNIFVCAVVSLNYCVINGCRARDCLLSINRFTFGDVLLNFCVDFCGVVNLISFISSLRFCLLSVTAPVIGCISLWPIALVRSFSSKIVEPTMLGW